MVFRRSDARRRRLVVEPAAPTGDAPAGSVAAAVQAISVPPSSPPIRDKTQRLEVRAYSYGAERRNQLKTTDLIPKRVLSYLLVVLVLIFGVAAINFLAVQSTGWEAQIGDAGLTAFAISGQGSIANWFLSFLLIITALACLQIYAIRQHRCDDYRGSYRLWVWMAAVFVIASINCCVDLGAVAVNLTKALTTQSMTDRAWLVMAAKLTALTVVIARVMYEVRQSRGSLTLTGFVWIAFTLALVLQMPVAKPDWMVLSPGMVAGNCILFGTAALLLAHLTYGRFIFLQANGLIRQKSRTKAVAEKKRSAAEKKKSAAEKKKAAAAKKKAAASKHPETADSNASKKRSTTKKKTSPAQVSRRARRGDRAKNRHENRPTILLEPSSKN